MPFNVTDFRSALKYDGARPNLFECRIHGLDNRGREGENANGSAAVTGAKTQFTFMCRTAQLPGSTVNAVPLNYFGRELKFAGNRLFTEWTVTIINDEDFLVRNAMEQWMSKINSHVQNKRDGSFVSPTDYTADATVIQFPKVAKDVDRIKKYEIVGMFPIDITPIELDWGANDTIEEFAVTFAYQWWESNTTDSST